MIHGLVCEKGFSHSLCVRENLCANEGELKELEMEMMLIISFVLLLDSFKQLSLSQTYWTLSFSNY